MAKSRMEKTKINILTSLALKITTIIMAFASRVIFVKILSAEYLGINGLFSNILNILSLADLGMSSVLMYSLYKPLANKDERKIAALVAFFRKVYLLIALIVAIIGIILIPFLKYIVNFDKNVPNITIYYLLFLLNNVISYLYIYRATLISADQKQYLLSKYAIAFQFITFIAQTIVLVTAKNYIVYLLVGTICGFLCNMLQNKKALEMYPYIKSNKDSILCRDEKKEIFVNVKSLFLYKIGAVIQNNTDNILISIFAGTIIVGYYSNYTMVINNVVNIIALIFSSVKASIGNFMVQENDENQKYHIFNVMELVSFWIVGFSSICFMILIPDFITILFGKEYVIGFSAVLMATLGFYTNQIRQAIWTFRETTGLFMKTRHITIVTSVFNLIFSILLGKKFGLFGILAGTIIARMIYAWWREPVILFNNVFNRQPWDYYKKYLIRVGLCVICYLVIYFTCEVVIISNIYLGFAIKTLLCILVPNGLFYIIYRRTKEFNYIRCRLIKR